MSERHKEYLIGTILSIAVLFIMATLASPFYTIINMKYASYEESDTITEYVDADAVTKSVRKLVVLNMLKQIERVNPTADADEITISIIAAMNLAEPVIQVTTEPANIAAMINGAPLTTDASWDMYNRNDDRRARYDVHYIAFDEFILVTNRKNSDESREYKLVFEREGLFSWKLKSVKFEI
jgi:hypothetical protein